MRKALQLLVLALIAALGAAPERSWAQALATGTLTAAEMRTRAARLAPQ